MLPVSIKVQEGWVSSRVMGNSTIDLWGLRNFDKNETPILTPSDQYSLNCAIQIVDVGFTGADDIENVGRDNSGLVKPSMDCKCWRRVCRSA